MPPLPRAVCPWCHSDRALRRNGTFRQHERMGTLSIGWCPGSGRRPEDHPRNQPREEETN